MQDVLIYRSMRSACDVHRELRRFHVLWVETDVLFVEIDAEANTE